MEENTNQSLGQLQKTIAEMALCDKTTLTAALAMLPDFMEDGASTVIGAAARIFAERFSEDLDKNLGRFREIIEENIKQMKNNE